MDDSNKNVVTTILGSVSKWSFFTCTEGNRIHGKVSNPQQMKICKSLVGYL